MQLKATLPCLLALACAAGAASAQQASRTTGTANANVSERSFVPGTQSGYMGLSVGQSKYHVGSGTGPFGYDDSDTAFKIYTGGYFNPYFGLELGYLNMGKADRIGGNTKAQGLNLSLVGRLPVSDQFDVFGKLGTTYGRTRTTGYSGYDVNTGKDNGFGLAYGVGVRWAFTPQWAAVLEWERHRFHFADGKSNVDMTSLGVQYRF